MFALSLQPGGRSHVSVMPRYPGAERDRPWLSARFDFADTTDGDDARRTLQDSLDFGTRGVIPAEHISELTLNVPAGLGTRLGEGYEVMLGTPAPNVVEEVSVALAAVDSTGSVMAQLHLSPRRPSRGTRGVEISLRDKSGAVTATVRGDASELTFKLTWHYSQPDEFAPLDLLGTAVKFAAAVEGGAPYCGRLQRRDSRPRESRSRRLRRIERGGPVRPPVGAPCQCADQDRGLL